MLESFPHEVHQTPQLPTLGDPFHRATLPPLECACTHPRASLERHGHPKVAFLSHRVFTHRGYELDRSCPQSPETGLQPHHVTQYLQPVASQNTPPTPNQTRTLDIVNMACTTMTIPLVLGYRTSVKMP